MKKPRKKNENISTEKKNKKRIKPNFTEEIQENKYEETYFELISLTENEILLQKKHNREVKLFSKKRMKKTFFLRLL